MTSVMEKDYLLEHYKPDELDDADPQSQISCKPSVETIMRHPADVSSKLKGILVYVLVFLNIVLLSACLVYIVQIHHSSDHGCLPEGGLTPYARLARDPAAVWPYSSGYGPDIENHTLLRERWNAISINDGIVAIDNDYAFEHNLGESQPFPWDSSKSLYLITAFHQVHCATTVGQLLYELDHGLPPTIEVKHALHCLDHWRTDAMCEADDYLLPTGPPRYMNHGPRGQARVCRNWDQLVAWAKERNSCYGHITDNELGFGKQHSQLERFASCPPDSPYFDQVQEWKRVNGIE